MNPRPLLAVSLFAVVGLAACGGGSGSSPFAGKHDAPKTSSSTRGSGNGSGGASTTSATRSGGKAGSVPQACELVTKEQADTVLGTTLQPGVAVRTGDANSCTYAGDPNGPTAQFEIFVGPGAEQYYDTDVQLQHTFTDVPGLGDEAHEEDGNLFFRTGGTWVALRVTSLDDFSNFKDRLESLAREVEAKL